jgi:hypothetical protein
LIAVIACAWALALPSARAEEKLFEIARGAGDEEIRQAAIHRIGQLVSERSFRMLGETVNSSGEKTEIQLQAVRADPTKLLNLFPPPLTAPQ